MRNFLVLSCTLAVLLLTVTGIGIVRADAIQTINITASPNTLILSSGGSWVTVHTDLPYGSVATATLELNGIEVAWTKSDSKGYLVAKFNTSDVKEILSPPDAELTLSGMTKDGIAFSGSDIIRVLSGPRK